MGTRRNRTADGRAQLRRIQPRMTKFGSKYESFSVSTAQVDRGNCKSAAAAPNKNAVPSTRPILWYPNVNAANDAREENKADL